MFCLLFVLIYLKFILILNQNKVLPFLTNTKVLLYPFTLLIIVYFVTIGLNINLSKLLMNAYEYRVLSFSP